MMYFMRILFLGLLATITAMPQQWPPQPEVPSGRADTLYYNGKIITMWPERPVVESMTTAEGRIIDVGVTQVVGRRTGPTTRQVNLNGKTMLPGLIDSHVHPIGAALAEQDGMVPVMRSFQDLRRYVEQAAGASDGLVFVPKVYSTRLQERRYPDRWEIDEYSGDHPVMFDNGYASALNSAALQLAGISRTTPDPPNGKLIRNEEGEPTGLIIGARQLVSSLRDSRQYSHTQSVEALKSMQQAYNSVGLTSVIDRSLNAGRLNAYQELRQGDGLKVRTYATYSVNAERPLEQVLADIEKLSPVTGHGDDMFRMGTLKVFLDGGILLGTAYMRTPYGENSQVYGFVDPDYRGELRVAAEDLVAIVHKAAESGWQVTAHTTGGASTDILLDAYEAVNQTIPIRDRRFTLTHANFLNQDAIERAVRLGVVVDMQPAWYHFDGPALSGVLGPQRMGNFHAYRSIFDAGLIVAGGSDHMIKFDSYAAINPYNPFFGMWMAITRKTSDGTVYNPEQKINREEALRMWTMNAAYLSFEEKVKGSLEPGKHADFVIIDRDILTCPEDEIREIQVLETVLAGKTVYQASSANN